MNSLIYAKVSKRYPAFELQPFDFYLNECDIVGLIGANGAGKTTFLNLLEGRCLPSSGEIYYKGRGMKPISWKKNPVVSFYDGICPFCEKFNPKDICTVMADWYPKWSSEQYFDYLNFLNVQIIAIKQMSLGTKNKLMLATMLAQNPEILFCDELTTGLDPVAREKVLHLLKEYINKTHSAVIFSTHIISDLEKFASRIILLDNGKVVLNTDISCILEGNKISLENVVYDYLSKSTLAKGNDNLIL